MTDKNRNLLIRVASAVVLLPVVFALLSAGGLWTAALLGFAAGACAYEYLAIVLKSFSAISAFTVAMAAALPFAPVLAPSATGPIAAAMTGVVLFAAWTWHLWRGPLPEAAARSAHLLMAFVYGAGGLTALSVLRQGTDGGWWLLAALVVTWGNDTAAYAFGRLFGKHRLYPEVSPNKTWEGFAGGFVGSIGALLLERALAFPALTLLDCAVLGALAGVFGPLGDLSESMLKRAYAVKDSGRIIPGHGGMLDRIDALIFNAPVVLLYVQLLRPLM